MRFVSWLLKGDLIQLYHDPFFKRGKIKPIILLFPQCYASLLCGLSQLPVHRWLSQTGAGMPAKPQENKRVDTSSSWTSVELMFKMMFCMFIILLIWLSWQLLWEHCLSGTFHHHDMFYQFSSTIMPSFFYLKQGQKTCENSFSSFHLLNNDCVLHWYLLELICDKLPPCLGAADVERGWFLHL